MKSPIIAIHGGCGTLAMDLLSPSEWEDLRTHLATSLLAGYSILKRGGTSVDAVEAAVIVMEDSPHFNAGHGAALTESAEHELDASIMDGATLAAGAVCTVRRIRNPVRAARAVMQNSGCVLLAGGAADAWAEQQGLPMVENGYFTTERRLKALLALKARQEKGTLQLASEAERHGTVGAVALDGQGNLAAATSTGGFNNKPTGRVGDTPIIGAGTYAKNGVCAVSCTGQGEVFIRRVAAHEVAARIQHAGQTVTEATRGVIFDELSTHQVGAGMIALDAEGKIAAPFNTLGMARGWIDHLGVIRVATHSEVFSMGEA